jgi:hypothetical protein
LRDSILSVCVIHFAPWSYSVMAGLDTVSRVYPT